MIASDYIAILDESGQSPISGLAPMNVLPRDKQIAAVSALVEGCSIRTTERLTGVHRDTVMRLGARVGQGCAVLHDSMMQNLQVSLIELDEAWSFVGKKQRRTSIFETDKGDQYVFIALDSHNKAILSYLVGKRNGENTLTFCNDLRSRVINAPQVSSDSFPAYADAMRQAFGNQVHYGQITKRYVGEPPVNAARRYSPGIIVAVEKAQVIGKPAGFQISTSLVERQNLTLRMSQRRLTRLSNGFSKRLDNHKAAIALYVAHYNLCRVHETIRSTPAMALGITDHIWTIGELVEAALEGALPEPEGKRVGRFTVIDGGREG